METSPEIDYSSRVASHGSYRQNRVLPLNQSSVPLNPSSSTETQIEFPNKVFNLAKSSLDFNVEIPATAARYTYTHKLGQSMIERISLYTREGIYLADLTSAFEFTNAVSPYVEKLDDLMDKDSNRGAATAATANDKGSSLSRSSVAVPTTFVAAGYVANGTRIAADGTNEAPDVGLTEPTYFTGSDLAGPVFMKYSVPLKSFHHTLLALDKDLYFGQALQMRVHWQSASKIGWTSNSVSNVSLGPAAPIATTIQLTNIRLQLAVETDPDIIQSVVGKVQSSGMKLTIPYVYSQSFSTPSGTSSSIQYRYNRTHGKRLLNIYSTVLNSVSTGRRCVDNNNVDIETAPLSGIFFPAKVVSFQSQLDNTNLTENRPLCGAENEDYVLMRDMMKGSLIQSSNVYKANRVWIDSWRAGRTCDWPAMDQVHDGISLDVEHIYSQDFTTNPTPAAYRIFTFAVVQRDLMINADGSVNF
jgi:hypothetical protein